MNHIYIDIETRATTREDIIARVTSDVRPPSNYKSAEAIGKWWQENGENQKAEAVAKTALSGLWGSVFCIGFAVNDEPVKVVAESNECETLECFEDALRDTIKRVDGNAHYWEGHSIYVGHNIESFDLRFLWQRSKVTGAQFRLTLPVERYPKVGPGRFDTMTEWAGWGGRVSQRDLELAFGLERNDPLPNGGADVHQALLEGREADVLAHCAEDIRLLREIHKRIVA